MYLFYFFTFQGILEFYDFKVTRQALITAYFIMTEAFLSFINILK